MNFKSISTIILTIFLLGFSTSCEEYLEENYYSGTDIATAVKTEAGIESLVAAAYVPMKMWYGKEYGWDVTTVGTDLWTYAGDADDMINLGTYTATFNNSWPGRFMALWAELYKGLNTINTTLEYLPGSILSADLKKQREGELRFIRAMYLWKIVETWGEVSLPLEPITEPIYTMTRSSVDKFYTQIFADLDAAINLLPATLTAEEYGRAQKYAAYAMRSRANLYWAAEYMSGNAASYTAKNGSFAPLGRDHYAQAVEDAQKVIDNGGYALYDDLTELWAMDNNASADANTENIWAVNYSNTKFAILNLNGAELDYVRDYDPKPFSEREGGSHGHMMFGMRWFAIYRSNTILLKDDAINTMPQTEVTRPFCRYMPTKYLMDLYKPAVDERWAASFNNVFYANNPDTTKYPTWSTFDATRADADQSIMTLGDTAFIMFRDGEELDPTNAYVDGIWYLHKEKGYFYMNLSDMYDANGVVNQAGTNERRTYFDLQKWYDQTRTHNGANQDIYGSQVGQRDFVVFRLPEMYYNIAEAKLASGDAAGAYAALKAIADKRAVGGDGAALLAAYGVNGGADVTIDFILDDKGREFAGEQQRWFDLKRTGKTLERIKAHNPDAANIEEKHLVRPIPQIELDAIENNADFTTGPGIY